jgi:methyl-accepting chemotaxis protein
LETFVPSEAAKVIRAKIDAAATKARALNNRVMDLAMNDRPADAVALLEKEAAPATQQWQDALNENIALQTRTNAAQYEEAEIDYQEAHLLLIGSGLVSTLVAVALTWWVVGTIVAELGGEPSSVAAVANAIADADFSTSISVRLGDETSVVSAMARMQAALARTVSSVRESSQSVATASAQIAQGNLDLSKRTEEQSAALEATAASMEQLSSTVQQNADNARQANQLASGASDVAVKGGEVVSEVVKTMRAINDSSKKIADIITVIDAIAFQTNILALNAAVEAARAGEQGRGFAVVASEVRNLAHRSGDAAKEIKCLITSSVERVEHGSALVDRAGLTMNEVVGSIQRVSDIMGEISAASSEQSAGVTQVGSAIVAMDQSTQQNAALVEQTAAAAESLKIQALQLVETVAAFRV